MKVNKTLVSKMGKNITFPDGLTIKLPNEFIGECIHLSSYLLLTDGNLYATNKNNNSLFEVQLINDKIYTANHQLVGLTIIELIENSNGNTNLNDFDAEVIDEHKTVPNDQLLQNLKSDKHIYSALYKGVLQKKELYFLTSNNSNIQVLASVDFETFEEQISFFNLPNTKRITTINSFKEDN